MDDFNFLLCIFSVFSKISTMNKCYFAVRKETIKILQMRSLSALRELFGATRERGQYECLQCQVSCLPQSE